MVSLLVSAVRDASNSAHQHSHQFGSVGSLSCSSLRDSPDDVNGRKIARRARLKE